MTRTFSNLMLHVGLSLLVVHCAATGSGGDDVGETSASVGVSSSSSSGATGGAGGMTGSGETSSSSVGTSTSSSNGGMMASAVVLINEVESSGGIPGDWVEISNDGQAVADVSGWVLKDNDDTHVYVIPAGTTIAPGQYFILEEAMIGYGFGAADSVRLFDKANKLVDEFVWTDHSLTTLGRCPNGSGGSIQETTDSSKGGPNKC